MSNFEEIKRLLESIQQHYQNDKVTMFNKEKNNRNKHLHNITEGKLLAILKQYAFFNAFNEQYGGLYLLRVIEYIEPYFLREERQLVNLNQNVHPPEYVLIEGVLKLIEIIQEEQDFEDEEESCLQKSKSRKSFQPNGRSYKITEKFRKYLANGYHINLLEYKESRWKIISHDDCQMIKFPYEPTLDPIKRSKKLSELNRRADKNLELKEIVDKVAQLHSRIRKTKKDVEIDSRFGLGGFDYLELMLASEIRTYSKHQVIFEDEENIDKIGLILKGRVMQEEKRVNSKKFVSVSNTALTFFKKDYNEDQKKLEIHQFPLEEDEWVGLQEYIQLLEASPTRMQKLIDLEMQTEEKKFQEVFPKFRLAAKREITSFEESEILWVPLSYFARKFNYQLNFHLVDRWSAMLQIKKENKIKNDNLRIKFETSPQKETKPIELPKLAKQRLEKMGHDLGDIEEKTELRTKIFVEKNKRMAKYKKAQSRITVNSLLSITMVDKQPQPFFEMDNRAYLKSFSNFTKETLNKKLFGEKKPSLNVPRPKVSSQNSFVKKLKAGVEESPEDLIMYPQAYEADNLPPELKKFMIQASKLTKSETIDCHLSKKQQGQQNSMSSSRATSFYKTTRRDSESRRNNSSKKLTQNRSLQSIQEIDLNESAVTFHKNPSILIPKINSPEKIYRGIASKISYKYPELDKIIQSQKAEKKSHCSDKFVSISIKSRIQALKQLQEQQRKKKKKAHLEILRNRSLDEGISMRHAIKSKGSISNANKLNTLN